MNIRRTSTYSLATLALVLLAGCGQKAAQNTPASAASTDSLLASSPVEQPQGQIQPQTNIPQQPVPAAQAQTPTPTPTPVPKTEQPKPKRTPPAPPAAPTATVAAGTGVRSGRARSPRRWWWAAWPRSPPAASCMASWTA